MKKRREASSIKRDYRDENRRGSRESGSSALSLAAETSGEGVSGEDWKGRAWQERELKFTASGWKRDCHGGWYKDENVRVLIITIIVQFSGFESVISVKSSGFTCFLFVIAVQDMV